MSDPRALSIVTADGARLVGDLAEGPSAVADAVLCHPHPAYGGDRFNPVIGALFDALAARGARTLRFDFRDALRTPSDDPAGGLEEAARDVAAAIETIRGADAAPTPPLVVIGYSYGALAALAALSGGAAEPAALVLVAPPLTVRPLTPTATVPTLIAVPAHDQFCPPDAAATALDAWPDDVRSHVELTTVRMADHFLAGRIGTVVDEVVVWLSRRGLLPSPP